MKNNRVLFMLVFLLGVSYFSAVAAKSVVKGDPEILWRTPLGKSEIDNTAKNRCLLIKKVKPGSEDATETNENVYELLSEYATNLYVQSIMLTAYIKEESEAEKKIKLPEASNEISIIKNKISRRLEDIARRINIINSLDAGTNMLTSLTEMVAQDRTVYNKIDCDKLDD